MKPLVVIVGRLVKETTGVRGKPFAAGRRYFHAIAEAGGTPLMLPPITSLVDDATDLMRRIDGVVLHGGGDIDPRLYGQEATAEELYGIVPEHDEVELAVVRAALELDRPMLAICRGMQMLNVALGGTLVQHIGSDDHWFRHSHVQLDTGSKVAEAMGTTTPEGCHCVHHQALDVLGEGMRVTGRTADGIVHAAEFDGAKWTVATQWHPEDDAHSDPVQQSLFGALVRHL
ncbi:MAG: gamma-glutamyl-gamma-aminobutyrate hydrolase family protein [Actinomycetota bacterium]